ncbi:hypothetical protein L4C36_16350, partial [Photobacterium japonica]|uniref:toxin VasX n=1 Tax=Photobacterium japonica TaxID=2910235 RepID=UPI003D0C0D86
MSSPIEATQSASNKDSRLPTGQCSLKQSRLQLVPVRYALSEHKPTHSAINSKYGELVDYRPVGIRPILEDGYIY